MNVAKCKVLSGYTPNVLLILGCLTLLKVGASENIPTAVEVHQGGTDGEQFLRRIVHGEKITDRPEFLIFTAPYRLCEGGCQNGKNFVLSFPLFIGKKGRKVYQSTYKRDALKIHSIRPNAPFKMKTTRMPMTTCPTFRETTPITTSTATTSTETTKSTELATTTEAATIAETMPLQTETTITTEDSEDPKLLELLFDYSDTTKKKAKRTCKNYSGLCLQKIKKKTTPYVDLYDNNDNNNYSQDRYLDLLPRPEYDFNYS